LKAIEGNFRPAELVFAITDVTGATVACAEHGDLPMVRQLASYYALAAETTRDAGGSIVKVIGDGILLTFPPSRAKEAVAALRSFQQQGTATWQQFDSRCRVQIRAGLGTVIVSPLGPPGDKRDDIFGDALNRLFKIPPGDFYLSPEMSARLS
jgi:class 3 adenylate cyclase